MEPAQDNRWNRRAARIAVSARLLEFYRRLRDMLEVDAEDFRRKIMERYAKQRTDPGESDSVRK